MKTTVFENIYTHEIWYCGNSRDVHVIDGVEYLLVNRHAQDRTFYMKRDSLKEVKDHTKVH
jgi:hypothetical protein